jgi:hypothetical protein
MRPVLTRRPLIVGNNWFFVIFRMLRYSLIHGIAPNPAFSTTGRIGAFCVTLAAAACGFGAGTANRPAADAFVGHKRLVGCSMQ